MSNWQRKSAVSRTATVGPGAVNGPKVLVAEDDLVSKIYIEGLLRKMGCEVCVASDGRAAVAMAFDETFDIVFMDCNMPIMNGFDATAILHRAISEERIPSVPIIALTANAFKENEEKCLACGMDDFLTKPVRKADIVKVIEKWVGELPILNPAPDLPSVISPALVEPDETIETDFGFEAGVHLAAATPMSPLSEMPENLPSSDSIIPLDDPTLDIDALDRTRTMVGTQFREILNVFCTETPQQIGSLPELIKNGDFEEGKRIVHSMKSSTRMMGAIRMTRLLEDMERTFDCRSSDQMELTGKSAMLVAEYDDYKNKLRTFSQAKTNSRTRSVQTS